MQIQYKERKPSVAEYDAMRLSVGWNNGRDKDKIKLAIKRSLYFITAYEGKKLVGMGRIIGDEGYAFYIQDVIVLPDYQGKGIGKEMMDRIMAYFDKKGIRDAMIGLLAAKDKEKFYEKYGFIFRPNEKLGAGMVIFRNKQ